MFKQIESFVESQKYKLRAYLDPSIKSLEFPRSTYFSQRDNYTMPHRTCNSSANAMYLDWLLACTKGKRLGGDDGYLKRVLAIGDTIYHENQTATLKQYGFSTKWIDDDSDIDFVEGLLDVGIPVVVNILHRGTRNAPRGGHVIMLVGIKGSDYLAQDPYGTLDSNYSDTNGRLDGIDRSEFASRWQGGYRILA